MSSVPNSNSIWRLPAALLVLSAIPAIAGSVRLAGLATGVAVTSDNARFFASPMPVAVHVVAASLLSVVGAFQFSRGVRLRWPRWHRYAGGLLLACSLATALSGLWMTEFYPWPPGDGVALYCLRLVFGSAMACCSVLSLVSLLRRRFVDHGAWILRAYAIGLGAGTQAFDHLLWRLFFGPPGETTRSFLMGGAWVINLVIAEWIIRRRAARAPRRRELAQPSWSLP